MNFDEENIIKQNLEKWEVEEENDSQKEQNSSRETSQNEKSIEKEEISKEKKSHNIKNKDKSTTSISSYILKHSRKDNDEIAIDTGIKKAEKCLYKLDIKLIPKNTNSEIKENLLVIYCHEIAAFYFDEIYEKIYTLEDLCKENKYFRVFESNDAAKIEIDEFIKTNEKNSKKFFIEFKDNELKIHMRFSFFDKEKEVIMNIPKKKLDIKEKNNLLPEFLKEIQEKMNRLSAEYKQLKNKNLKKKIKNDLKNNNVLNESNEIINKNDNLGVKK